MLNVWKTFLSFNEIINIQTRCSYHHCLFPSASSTRGQWSHLCKSKYQIALVWYIKILTWLRGFKVKIAFFFFHSIVSKFSEEIWAQRKSNQISKMTRKPRGHVRIFIHVYRTWVINIGICKTEKKIVTKSPTDYILLHKRDDQIISCSFAPNYK